MSRESKRIAKIGDQFDNLLIVGYEPKGKYKRSKYIVQCQICKNDPELYGDATYTVNVEYLSNDKQPCGCSYNPKRTEKEWIVLLNRKAKENNHDFLGFKEGWKDQNSKVLIHCKNCGHNYDSCSLSNYLRDRDCPKCASLLRATKRSTSDTSWIERFRNEGNLPNTLSFTRQTKTGRLWNVTCSVCNPNKVFVADRSNLVAGKIPCDCSIGGGYDKTKKGYLYVLLIQQENLIFCGYGITNFPKRRIVDHVRETGKKDAIILTQLIYEGDGSLVLETETNLKKNFPRYNSGISAFKREATPLENYTNVIEFVENSGLKKYEHA